MSISFDTECSKKAHVLEQQVKALLAMPAFHTGVPTQEQAALLPIQLFAKEPVKVADDGPNPWVPATHVGDEDEGPSSRFQPGQDLAVLAFWRVNQ